MIARRNEQADYLLPSLAFSNDVLTVDKDKFNALDQSFFFDRNTIVNALSSNNYETTSIEQPYEPKPAGNVTFIYKYLQDPHYYSCLTEQSLTILLFTLNIQLHCQIVVKSELHF